MWCLESCALGELQNPLLTSIFFLQGLCSTLLPNISLDNHMLPPYRSLIISVGKKIPLRLLKLLVAKGYFTSSCRLLGSVSGPPCPVLKEDVYQPSVECFQNNICKTPWSLEGVTEVHEIIFAYLRKFTFLQSITNNRN